MEYITNTTDFQLHNTAIALGKFEGLHRGHNVLLQELYKQHEKGLKSVMFTFDMSPKAVISNDFTRVIYTKDERRKILERTPLQCMIEHPFTEEFSKLSPEEFIRDVLVAKAGAKVIVIGEDCRFGYRASGNAQILKELAPKYGYEAIVVSKLKANGLDVSSSQIRDYINRGKMEWANYFLGEPPFTVFGEVVHGKKLGSSVLGMPTANQAPPANKYLPPNGVYVSRIICKGETYYGISNIGVKPTVDADIAKGIETFIFDFDQDIYGTEIEVQLLYFVRPEMRFASLSELAAQMKADAEFGKNYAKNYCNN